MERRPSGHSADDAVEAQSSAPMRRNRRRHRDHGMKWREQWQQHQSTYLTGYYYFYSYPFHPAYDLNSGEPVSASGCWQAPTPVHYSPNTADHHGMAGPVFISASYFEASTNSGVYGPQYWVPYDYPSYQGLERNCNRESVGSMATVCAVDEQDATVTSVRRDASCNGSSSCGKDSGEISRSLAFISSFESGSRNDDPEPTDWGSLTMAVLHIIMTKLGDGDVKQLRLVCRHWCRVVDHNLESLTPNDLKARVLVKRFSNLKVLHLTNCCDIRNRSLWIISKAGLNLHTLTLGDDTTKPWVTNSGLECIAHMTSLTSLSLHECGNVTNKGVAALSSLTCLASLSLRGCCRLTNAAFDSLQSISSLTSLNLYGCRLTDQGLLPLTRLQLLSLHLGNTRVRDEGLAYLAQITTLQELHFHQEELSDVGVAQLTSLTRLQSLALRDCAQVSSDSLSVLIPAMPNLVSLDLYKNFTMDDSQLTRCLEFLGAVTYLDLRGTPVTEGGLQQLTKLTSLQKLCLAPTKEDLWSQYLCVVSNLTQLTSLSINNCTLISFRQLETLRQLKLLRELDLSGDSKEEARQLITTDQSVEPNAMSAMTSITSLTSIDLSRRPVHQEHLSTLAEGLPRLHTLIIVGCPVLYTEVQSLQRRFPDLVIHRKPLFYDNGSCSSSDHGIG